MNDELIKYALIGLEGKSTPITAQEILQYFGVHQMQHQAGFITPKTIVPLPEAAPFIETQSCNYETATQFFQLEKKKQSQLLNIWVEKFSTKKLHFPDELIPTLLDKPKNFNRVGRTFYVPLMSKRAKWLVEYSKKRKWNWFLDYYEDDTNLGDYPTENPVLWFLDKRSSNPSQAREWLITNWHELRSTHQIAMLHALREGLSEDDISFLETLFYASDNSTNFVVQYDVILLLSLLNSECVQNIICNILKILNIELMEDRGFVIDFCWSNIFEKTMQPDDCVHEIKILQSDNYSPSLGDMIRLVPLEYWYKRWYIGFLGMMKASFKGKHGTVIATAWLKRVMDERNEDIAISLLSNSRVREELGIDDYHSQLVQTISFERFQKLMTEQLTLWQSHI